MNNKNNQELFNEQEEKYLKRYFQKLDRSLGVDPETPVRLQIAFNQKLGDLDNPKKSKVLSWKVFGASLAGAFSIGALLARFLLMPVEVATKGIGGDDVNSYRSSNNPPIVVITSEPEKLVMDAIQAAFNTDLEVTTIKAGDSIQLTLKPLRPHSKEQLKVKSLLKINENLSGEATVIVKLKP